MKFQGALIKEQGVTFAVVIVRPSVLSDPGGRERLRASFSPAFGSVPVVLMAQDGRGVPTYHGRHDLARFLAKVPLRSIPWREFTIN